MASSAFVSRPISLVLLSFILILSSLCTTDTAADATTIPLMRSPKYPSSSTDPWEYIAHMARTTLSRAHHLKHPPRTTATTAATHNDQPIHANLPVYPRSYGGYSLPLSFGTPPQKLPLVMDTGSSLVWAPCTSSYICSNCNFSSSSSSHRDSTASIIPAFLPNRSSTVRLIGCENPKCSWVFGPDVRSTCQSRACPDYVIEYGLGSTMGLLVTDFLDLPGEDGIQGFAFGCSVLSDEQPEGIAGFGRGPVSLPTQLGLKGFSYCLVSHDFDDSKVVSGSLVLHGGEKEEEKEDEEGGFSYTPFGKNPAVSPYSEYYYVTLRKITVGGKRVNIHYRYLVPGPKGNGGTIVDSGSTFTYMERAVHGPVAEEFARQMGRYKRSEKIEGRSGLGPCFDILSAEEVDFPNLEFHFKGGAKMSLPLKNYFSVVGGRGLVCLTVMTDSRSLVGPNVSTGPAIIVGNYQQQNFHIKYDLEKGRFGFKEKRCR